MCIFKHRWRKLLNVATFVIFPTSIMVLFEIYQRFKDQFLNKMRVSFNTIFKSLIRITNQLNFINFLPQKNSDLKFIVTSVIASMLCVYIQQDWMLFLSVTYVMSGDRLSMLCWGCPTFCQVPSSILRNEVLNFSSYPLYLVQALAVAKAMI